MTGVLLYVVAATVPGGLVGFALARLRGARDGRGPTALLCSCGCPRGDHVRDGNGAAGECRAQVCRPHYRDGGTRNGYEWVRCACQGYDGPTPLPAFYAVPLPPVGEDGR